MKQRHQFHVLLLFLFLIFIMRTSARVVAKRPETTSESTPAETAEDDNLNLMDVEVCTSGDEECLKRRIVSEAHLDYIYSQRHHHR